jgi:hypothetical protein
VFEASLSRVDHRGPGFVAGLDGLIVIAGAAGLNHGRDPLLQADIHSVPKGEKRIADHAGACQPAFFPADPLIELGLPGLVLQVVVRYAQTFETLPVGQFAVGLVPGNLGHTDPVLLSGADAHRDKILDIDHRV